MTSAGLVPVTLELLDRFTIDAVEAALQLGLDLEAGAMLMIESDAGGARLKPSSTWPSTAVRRRCDLVARAADASRGRLAARGTTQGHWSLEQAGVARMEDVGVPRSRVAELLIAIEPRSAPHGMDVGVFGHAGDGNFHPTFVTDARRARTPRHASTPIRADIYADVLALGGTISGEHGTGIVKRGYLEAQRGARSVATMRAIKAALDPEGILNPGKVLPD